MPLKLWEKTLSREVAHIILISVGHPVLESGSNDGWALIKMYFSLVDPHEVSHLFGIHPDSLCQLLPFLNKESYA